MYIRRREVAPKASFVINLFHYIQDYLSLYYLNFPDDHDISMSTAEESDGGSGTNATDESD